MRRFAPLLMLVTGCGGGYAEPFSNRDLLIVMIMAAAAFGLFVLGLLKWGR